MKETYIKISIFRNIKQTTNGYEITIAEFFYNLRNGNWRKNVEIIRNEPDKSIRKKLKEDTLPYVTVSGVFNRRSDRGLKKHSGLICIDMDKIKNIEEVKNVLKSDPYTYAVFVSVTGTGLAVIVRIEPEKHIESFFGLERYYFEKYSIKIDESCKDVSRARFVSYDPDLFVNPGAEVFTGYVVKKDNTKCAKSKLIVNGKKDQKELEELTSVIEHIIKEIEEKSIILGDDGYGDWFKIACALADGFGEKGREYFHRVSAISSKYDKEYCDKQYDACLNGSKPDNKITISTFFHYVKGAGLEIGGIVDLVDIVDVESKRIDKMLIPLQQFPLDVFPQSVIKIINGFSNSLGVETEVIGSSMLTIVSSAIGNTIRVSPKYGYEVSPFIWLIIIAISGYGKTPAISTLVRPIEKRQSKTYMEYNERLKRYKDSLRKSKQGEHTETVEEPILEHFFASDTTVEALGDVFENNPRGILIYRDELAGLILGLNQYKGGSKGNDRQHYLELFNCGSWKIDRKTGVKFIPNVGASIIGGIQTTIVPKVFRLDAIGEGLLPRFLLLNTEYKPRKFQRQGIDPDDLNLWSDILEKCYEIPLSINESCFVTPKVLILEEEALNLFEEFHDNYMNLMPFLSDNVKSFVPKFITYCLKIAGILHILECFATDNTDIKNSIKAGTMDRAIKLTRYFAGQSINALELYRTNTKKELNELESRLLRIVFSLEDEIKNGKLALSRIGECFNVELPGPLQCNSKQIGVMLSKQGLETKKSTNGYYFLLWDKNKIKKLKATSTMSTITTNLTNTFDESSPKVDIVDIDDMSCEDNVIDLENEKVEIIN